jgi:hypothetical protein
MRTTVTLTREGFARAWTARRLVVLVWSIHLALAFAAAFPLWRMLDAALGPLPEGDVLQGGVVFGAVFDLAEMRPGLLSALGLTLAGTGALGILVGAALTGGVLEVLHHGHHRSLGERFGRGAGRYFGRFLRLSLLVVGLAALLGGLAVLPFLHLARSYLRTGWGPGRWAPLGGVAVSGLVVLVALLVLDAGRIHIVRSDAGVLRGFRAGLGLVWSHPLVWAGTRVLNATLVGAAVALFVVFQQALPTDRGVLVLALVLAQQALMIVRTGLRVALLGSESALVERLLPPSRPAPPVPVAPQPAPSSPVSTSG